jgi:hypothetical protein
MSIDSDFSKSELLDRICDLVLQVSLGGGVGTSMNHLRRPGIKGEGAGLELWVKHFLAGTINRSNDDQVIEVWNKKFSFLGGSSNPPDVMMKDSLAAEVKKTEGKSGALQLNSSWPIRTLHVSDQHITNDCRQAENWTEKPFLFFIGQVKQKANSLKNLSIVDGRCLSDEEDVYLGVIAQIRAHMLQLGGATTKEIGRFNELDSTGRTNLRVRPMFSLSNPVHIFSEIFANSDTADFVLNVLLPESTYDSFPSDQRHRIENINPELHVQRTAIIDPTNSNSEMKAVLISGSW